MITKFVQRPGYLRLTNAFQCDYPMTDTFRSRRFDLQNYRSKPFNTVLLGDLPVGECGVSQSSGYWEFMETPQLGSVRPSSGICPCPTRLPHGPNAASELRARGPLEAVSTESRGYQLTRVFSRDKQPTVASCDHANCDPPPDVRFLSRRFEENLNWYRGRAAAVAHLSYNRRGCKLL